MHVKLSSPLSCKNSLPGASKMDVKCLRLDKANLAMYYDFTYLSSVNIPVELLHGEANPEMAAVLIN